MTTKLILIAQELNQTVDLATRHQLLEALETAVREERLSMDAYFENKSHIISNELR